VAPTLVHSDASREIAANRPQLAASNPYRINLFHVNADQAPIVYNELGPGFYAGRYNIGYWFWEVTTFPEEWFDRFRFFDEIWVASKFVQDALARVAPTPVVNMGLPLGEPSPLPISRVAHGWPTDRFVFLYAFDVLSVFERKNPLGLIEAYRRAFGPECQDTCLVLKAFRLYQRPHYRKQVEQAVASVSGILLDRQMDRREMDGLYDACDAYVSLHRSEGFGMTIAEAMSLGKPVVATAYSGNMDFMSVDNSYPVRFRLMELERSYGPYQEGSVWADPDLDHAAALMRRVFEEREEAVGKGRRAAADIRSLYGDRAIARRIIERLTHIERIQSSTTPLRHFPGNSSSPIEQLRDVAEVNPHLPIAWPTWPRGFKPKVVALVQKVVRRLLRWYIDPLVAQQNHFNAATTQTLDQLWREVSRLQAQVAQEDRKSRPKEE
jgi:glycosyltransferase involved in cell wall biosynthesis